MATDGGDDRWRNVLEARSVTVYPADGDPVDLQDYLDNLGAGEVTVAWTDVTGRPATFPPTIGTTATTAAAGNHTHSAYATTTALDALAARVAALESV